MTRTTTARRRQAAQERRESCLLHFMGLKLRASAARVSSSERGGTRYEIQSSGSITVLRTICFAAVVAVVGFVRLSSAFDFFLLCN